MSFPPIDIVTVTFNRCDYTEQFLDHIQERTRTPYRVIAIDNGSTDGTRDLLLGHSAVSNVQFLGENTGIHWAKNCGLKLVESPIYVDTDNDILCPDLDPDWLYRIVSLLAAHSSYGSLSLRPQIFVGSNEKEMFAGDRAVVATSHAGASLRAMRTALVRRVGGWQDVKRPGRDNEERWIASKFREVGYLVGYARNIRCWHCFGENWGYEDVPMEIHGHHPIWPPPEHWDGIKCDPVTWEPLA